MENVNDQTMKKKRDAFLRKQNKVEEDSGEAAGGSKETLDELVRMKMLLKRLWRIV